MTSLFEQIIDLNAKVKVAHAIRNPRAMLISSTFIIKTRKKNMVARS